MSNSNRELIRARIDDGLVHVACINRWEGERAYYRLLCEDALSHDLQERGARTTDIPTCITCTSASNTPAWQP